MAFHNNNNKKIIIYTDGGTRFNGSNGSVQPTDKCGLAYTLKYGMSKKVYYAGGFGASNNKMELQAILLALKSITDKTIPIVLYSDSNYSIQSVTKWAKGWEANGWKKKDGSEIKNVELIKEIYELIPTFNFIEFVHVKGHSGNQGNEEVDELLNKAMDMLDEGEDEFPVIEKTYLD